MTLALAHVMQMEIVVDIEESNMAQISFRHGPTRLAGARWK